MGTAAAASLAGCADDVTDQEFEASPVVLPEAAREELVLAETATDSSTTKREPEVAGVDGEVTITSHVAAYRRGPARGRPTVMEAFVGGVNGTSGPGSAVVVTGEDLGVDEVPLSMFEEEPTVAGSDWSLVVPAGAGTKEAPLEETLSLIPPTAVPELGTYYAPDKSTPGFGWRVPNDEWIPGTGWNAPGDQGGPADAWFPGMVYEAESPELLLVTTADSPEEVFDFGGPAGYDELPGSPIEEGESVELENTVLAIPGNEFVGGQAPFTAEAVFDAGVPAPLGGATFGQGVLSTPDAEVAGRSVNPVAGMGVEELLTSDEARSMLGATGATDAADVEWLRGPEKVPGQVWTPDETVTVLGEEVGLETYGGVVSGRAGPWAVAVHVARATVDDLVVTVAVHRRPVGTPDGRELFGDGNGFVDREWTVRAMELTGAAFANLESTPGDA